MSMPITDVQFRMYNTGSVGDCLLIRFMNNGTVVYKMMIDCGGWNADTPSITACAEDIKTTCKGELDLLVVTHQHEDHVSGFNQARAVFDKIKVKEVWMSWIEDDEDPVSKILRDKYGKKLAQLRKTTEMTLKRIQKQRAAAGGKLNAKQKLKEQNLANVLELVKLEDGDAHNNSMPVGKRTNNDAMKYVKSKTKNVKYKIPGEVVKDMPGMDGVKFYFLGPPRDEDMRYFKIEMEDDEMYHLALKAAAKEEGAEQPAPTPATERIFMNDISLKEGVSPFSDQYKMTRAETNSFMKNYNAAAESWRQIESDWLESDLGIAMRVTNLTNNTSLAMAIEFAGGKVMLLPGDGQSGNWLGWHKPDVKKKLKNNGGKDTDELLQNTVFYKVGHHGSHNGTASKSGLEKMKAEDMVAMMPLVQKKVPTAWGGAKNFPAAGLYDKLITKTQGRVIRTDEGPATKDTAVKLRSKLKAKQKKEFESSFRKGPIYMEYTLQGLDK